MATSAYTQAALADHDRLETLRCTGLLDGPDADPLHRLTRLATGAVGVPVCLVTLVTDDRQHIASEAGLGDPWATLGEMPLSHSFCQHVVTSGAPFVVADAREHPLVCDSPAIDDLGVVAYAGMPIVTRSGHVLGALCAFDHVPRQWGDEELELLDGLAAAAAAHVEMQLLMREREQLVEDTSAQGMRFQSLLGAAPGMIAVYRGPSHQLVFANEAWERVAAWRRERGDTAGQLFPELQEEGILTAFDQVFATGRPFSADDVRVRLYEPDGSSAERYHSISIVPTRRPGSDEVDGVMVHSIDVTARVLARRQVEQERQRLALLVEASAVLGSSRDYREALGDVARLAVPVLADWCIVDVIEPDGSLASIAVAAADPRKEHALRQMRQSYPPATDSQQPVACAVREGRAYVQACFGQGELEASACDGGQVSMLRELDPRSVLSVPLIVRGMPIGAITYVYSESGRAFGGDGTQTLLHRELAHRVASAIETSRLYRAAEHRARAGLVLDSISDGVMLVDERGVVRLWNPAALRITGITAGSVLGKPVASALPLLQAVVDAVALGDEPGAVSEPVQVPIDDARGERWLSVTATRITGGGSVWAFRDSTAEWELEQTRQELIATISHQLRTPLAAIYAAAVTLQRTDLELTSALRQMMLTTIEEQAEQLTSITSDILLACRLDAGTAALSEAHVDVGQVACEVVEAAAVHADGHELVLRQQGAVRRVAGDGGAVRQVLSNLVDNAIKYSPGGGAIDVTVDYGDDVVRFSVADRGIGIPEAERTRVFEKFCRLDPDMMRGVGGTGLGLYICQELVRRMGGEITVAERQGGGSVFSFWLPATTDGDDDPE